MDNFFFHFALTYAFVNKHYQILTSVYKDCWDFNGI